MLAIHEISHNLAFGHGRPLANRAMGIFANFSIGFPVYISFTKYHPEHHKFLADERLDPDVPTDLEGKLFHNAATKLLWVILQPFFYAFRPLIVNPKRPTLLEFVNLVLQVVFNLIIVYTCSAKSLVYLIGGSLMVMGLHPVAGHFISEHYMFKLGYETYSYYGPLNYVTLNVGYHMEHHDFPYIAGFNLPKVKKIAGEYYDDLPQHTSMLKVMYQFIFDRNFGPYEVRGMRRKTNAAVTNGLSGRANGKQHQQ